MSLVAEGVFLAGDALADEVLVAREFWTVGPDPRDFSVGTALAFAGLFPEVDEAAGRFLAEGAFSAGEGPASDVLTEPDFAPDDFAATAFAAGDPRV